MTTNSDNSVNTAGINAFADSVVSFLRTYGFDGVDIDYEYPTSMNNAGNPLDFGQANARRAGLNRSYPVLMKTLREKLDAAATADRKYYLLTVAAPSSGYLLRGQENFAAAQYLDYINIMSYDLHGAWNHFVGPNAALYDNGDDAELAFWNVYTTSQYDGAGYLNTDWAYHYLRGAVQSGRINIGVPFYTRGWQGVTGGTNGLWGRAALPDQSKCPAGTGGTVGSTVPCGNGAVGIDNLWHDSRPDGSEEPAGSNPMWHAKNLETGRTGDYLAAYGLTPATDPADRLTGTYVRNYSSALVAPWLWNDQKKVFLSTEDEQSIGAKADYVVSKGIGGVMFWEMAGDYRFDSTKNQYFMGSTLTALLFDKFKAAAPYGNVKAKRAMPTQLLDVNVELRDYALGDNNYPINPKLRITNSSALTIAAGAELQLDYPVSAPGNSADQSDWTWVVTSSEHTGANRGGYLGDFHHVSLKLPASLSIPPGGSAETPIVYYMPFAGPSNFTLTFGGQTYALVQDYPRGGTAASPTPTATAGGRRARRRASPRSGRTRAPADIDVSHRAIDATSKTSYVCARGMNARRRSSSRQTADGPYVHGRPAGGPVRQERGGDAESHPPALAQWREGRRAGHGLGRGRHHVLDRRSAAGTGGAAESPPDLAPPVTGRAVPALGDADLAGLHQLQRLAERDQKRRLERQQVGGRGHPAARELHRARGVPQPSRVRPGLALGDSRHLQHHEGQRLPGRADPGGARAEHQGHQLHDRRSFPPRGKRLRIFQLRGVLPVQGPHDQPGHAGRLRRVQLRQLL